MSEKYKACISCGRDTPNRCQICAICLGEVNDQQKRIKSKGDSGWLPGVDFDRDDCVNLDVTEAMREMTE